MMLIKPRYRYICVCFVLLIIAMGCAHGNIDKQAKDPGALSPSSGLAEEATNEKTPSGPVEPEPEESDAAYQEAAETYDDEEFFEDEDFFDEESEPEGGKTAVADPLYHWNYAMFLFNDKLYFWCLKPVGKGYIAVTPEFFRKGVRNFFHNLFTPARFVNSLLQGKVGGAGSEIGRFAVNTTIGVLGVWDPAERYLEWKPSEEDLGQTLGLYGIGNGFYIVWPVLGPSTLRDSVGRGGDMFLSPLYYLEPTELSVGLGVLEGVNSVSFRIGDYEAVKTASLNPYVMIRDFYVEHRKKQIAE